MVAHDMNKEAPVMMSQSEHTHTHTLSAVLGCDTACLSMFVSGHDTRNSGFNETNNTDVTAAFQGG